GGRRVRGGRLGASAGPREGSRRVTPDGGDRCRTGLSPRGGPLFHFLTSIGSAPGAQRGPLPGAGALVGCVAGLFRGAPRRAPPRAGGGGVRGGWARRGRGRR